MAKLMQHDAAPRSTGRQPRPSEQIPRIGLLEALGRARRFKRESLTVVQEIERRHGPVVMERMGPMRSVHLLGPDANRLVMQDPDGIFSAAGAWNLIMGRIFPNGLLLRDGDDHRRHRRIMQGAFAHSALRSYLDEMNPRIARALEGWHEQRAPQLAFPFYKRLTLDLGWAVFVGVELGEDAEALNRAFEAMVAASMSVVRLPMVGREFARGLRGRAHIAHYFRERLAEKRATQTPDVFSRLCHARSDEGETFEDGDIVDHMGFLMMAAHDTTTSTLSALTYELARNPDWQQRVRDESRALGAEPLQYDDLGRLASMALVIKETLRRYAPLSTVPRIARRDFELGGYLIPARTMAITYPLHTHHMPELWSDPERFDPERFSPERAEHKRHSHAYVPFSGGAHTCIGLRFAELQVSALMHQLLQRYRIRVTSGYRMPLQQAPISKPLDGLPLLLEPLRG